MIETALRRRSIEPLVNDGVKYTYSSVIEAEDEDGEEVIQELCKIQVQVKKAEEHPETFVVEFRKVTGSPMIFLNEVSEMGDKITAQ